MKRGIVLYRLDIAPDESDGEGECFDEWFSSLKLAKKRRAELIAENPDLKDHRYGVDFAIWRVEFMQYGRRGLLLRVLNRGGIRAQIQKVEAYVPPRNRKCGVTADDLSAARICGCEYDEGHGP